MVSKRKLDPTSKQFEEMIQRYQELARQIQAQSFKRLLGACAEKEEVEVNQNEKLTFFENLSLLWR